MGWWDWLRKGKAAAEPAPQLAQGLQKSREGFWTRIRRFFEGTRKIDPQSREEIEELLLAADVGPQATEHILKQLEGSLRQKPLTPEETLTERLRSILIEMIDRPFHLREGHPYVILLVGVNGAGKTTTLARLAYNLKREDKKVLLAAADTFRAAAVDQLRIWAERVSVPLVEKGMGVDPGAVAYEAVQKAVKEGYDVLLIDTAGRLHNRKHLMDELSKIYRVIGKALPGAPHEVLLVLDATTGQNALRQAEVFREAVHCTGIVLTKLDGTAKGGVAFAVVQQTGLPIRFVGVGERPEDLLPFSPSAFVEGLLTFA